MKFTRLAPMAVVISSLLLLGGCALPGGDNPGSASETRGINKSASDKSRVWEGTASHEVNEAYYSLSPVVQSNRDRTAGLSRASDGTMVEVYVTSGAEDVADEFRAVVGGKFDELVRVVEVENSTLDLLDAAGTISSDTFAALDIIFLGPEYENNAISIRISSDAWAALAPTSALGRSGSGLIRTACAGTGAIAESAVVIVSGCHRG